AQVREADLLRKKNKEVKETKRKIKFGDRDAKKPKHDQGRKGGGTQIKTPCKKCHKTHLGWVFNSLVHSFRALSALRCFGLRTASTAAKPYQGDSLEFYLITCRIPTVVAAGQKDINSQLHAHTSNSLSMTAKRPTTQLPQL
nr:zinc finger, CCHC-type, retrotransposon Gag domain protein [Tanacetum cinerariifolium]